MILARLLTPRDFGLVAMVWTIMGFLRVFKEAGLSTATVQREGITHAQVSNLFWINVGGERLDQSAGGGGCAGDCLVLPGAAARRDYHRSLRHLLAGWFGGPAHGASEPADAFQSDRTHPGRFCFGRSFGGRWHGLAELWLLVPGRIEPDDEHGCAFDDLVGIPLASSIFYPAQRHAVLAPFRRQPDRRDLSCTPLPGGWTDF